MNDEQKAAYKKANAERQKRARHDHILTVSFNIATAEDFARLWDLIKPLSEGN